MNATIASLDKSIESKVNESADMSVKLSDMQVILADTQLRLGALMVDITAKKEDSAALDIDIVNQNDTIAGLAQKIADLEV